ncbi:MAG: sulfite exporter TauE/SafE family protein [Verrucomicrobiae bacterium]|nr:sulfite exporter TauE/SafE family protein [Verrucomicrobiae bacterium]
MNPYHLSICQWAIALAGAFVLGVSKTGIAGVGSFVIAVFALILPARESTGIILPLLICGDVVAVKSYHRHAVWGHLWRLFPWAVTGIIIGYFTMDHINDQQVQRLIGAILLVMVAVHWWRRRMLSRDPEHADEHIPHGLWFSATMGLLAGFTTMVANAAGPIMILYLLAMGLPKMEFLGTGAWYFMILNVFKVPFSCHLGLINPSSFSLNLILAPAVVAGALWGRSVIQHINQKLFESIALVSTLVVGLRLLAA